MKEILEEHTQLTNIFQFLILTTLKRWAHIVPFYAYVNGSTEVLQWKYSNGSTTIIVSKSYASGRDDIFQFGTPLSSCITLSSSVNTCYKTKYFQKVPI